MINLNLGFNTIFFLISSRSSAPIKIHRTIPRKTNRKSKTRPPDSQIQLIQDHITLGHEVSFVHCHQPQNRLFRERISARRKASFVHPLLTASQAPSLYSFVEIHPDQQKNITKEKTNTSLQSRPPPLQFIYLTATVLWTCQEKVNP